MLHLVWGGEWKASVPRKFALRKKRYSKIYLYHDIQGKRKIEKIKNSSNVPSRVQKREYLNNPSSFSFILKKKLAPNKIITASSFKRRKRVRGESECSISPGTGCLPNIISPSQKPNNSPEKLVFRGHG